MLLSDLISRSQLPIGVELHAGGVRLLQLCGARVGLRARAASEVALDDAGRAADDPSWLRQQAAAVADAVRAGRYSGKKLVVGVDGRMVRTRSVRNPRLLPAEQDKAARLEAPSRLGFSESDCPEIGWLRAGEIRQGDDVKDELLYLGARRAPLDVLLEALAGHGLAPVAVEPNFTAASRCFTRTLRRASDENVSRVVVTVGPVLTEVMVTRGRLLAFYKQIEIGGRSMTRLASERLGLDPATVGELRQRRMVVGSAQAGAPGDGTPGVDPKVDRALFDAVRPHINDLVQEVTLCLRYYSVTFRGPRPEVIVVGGSEAAEPQLTTLLTEGVGVPAQVGKPLEGVDIAGVARSISPNPAAAAVWGACHGLCTRALELADSRKGRPWKERAAA